MARRLRSRYFIATGAAGGLFGFALMELVGGPAAAHGSAGSNVAQMALYFGGFGLAVGALLGMTEGLVQRRPGRMVYGLFVGLLLGGLGGLLGGTVGQVFFGLLPIRYAVRSKADVAIVLDSSGSMKTLLFWGNDPWGKRKDAARDLIDRLAPTDRVAVVDFDDRAKLLYPLSFLHSKAARQAAKSAADRVDSLGGTDLTAGLRAAVDALTAVPAAGRPRFVIFLTDGVGAFDPAVVARALASSITIYTVGLGSGVDAALLRDRISGPTGGEYFAVEQADGLRSVFSRIYTERIAMAARLGDAPQADSELLTSPALLVLFRIGSWALMGLVIGLGQGVRENTREDLRACAFGGFIGGLVGGGLFEPVSSIAGLGVGAWSRLLADVVVGASIGGTMRFAQERMVDALPKTTRLVRILPEREGLAAQRPSADRLRRGRG